MDAALLQAVEANRKALTQFVGSGVALSEKPLQDALANVEKMEDTFFSAIGKAGKLAGPLQEPWEHALSALQIKGSATGMQATQTVDTLMAQAQTALRDSRASSMRAAKAMLDSYSAMVSGVLLGMSEGLAGTRRACCRTRPGVEANGCAGRAPRPGEEARVALIRLTGRPTRSSPAPTRPAPPRPGRS